MKTHKTTRVYLTVEVEEPWESKPADWASRGRLKRDELNRLLGASNLDYLGDVDWHVEAGDYCSHCGYDWEEDETGCPVCCDAAIKEHIELHRS